MSKFRKKSPPLNIPDQLARFMKFLILFFFLPSLVFAYEFTGYVVKVSDGDTITVRIPGNYEQKIRLAEIDAPEKAQPFGNKSK